METIVRSNDELEKLRQLPLYETFSRSDHNGKIGLIRRPFSSYYNREDFSDYTEGEKEFAETLKKALGLSGMWAILATLEGSRTVSKNRDQTIHDVVEETEKILNDEEYRKLVDTELKRNPEMYEIIKKHKDSQG